MFSVFVGFFLLLISVYLPVSQALLKTVPLGFVDWLIVFALGFINMFFIEIAKRYFIIKERAKARIL